MELSKPQGYALMITTAVCILLFGVPGAMNVLQNGVLGTPAVEDAAKGVHNLATVVEQLTGETVKLADKVGKHDVELGKLTTVTNRNQSDIDGIQNRLRELERESARLATKMKGAQ